ncbi:MAG: glycoside hydrolase family 3 C-terminal domain-containing protein [Anaerolineales bacterium]|nr:glycoside hydrolase family 3 C-terminal domain-containing protein [Anaerolineales bacterium]
MQNTNKTAIYKDPNAPVTERVADLMSKMTVEEKVAQLGSIWSYQLLSDDEAAAFEELLSQGIGHITRIAGASSLKPSAAAALANRVQKYLVEETRLGIPAIVHEECNTGFMAMSATCFPQMIGVASTWEPELIEALAAVVRTQMRAIGAHQGLSPVIDIARDPRWGRIEETFGEDPYLVASMGAAFVKSLQGDDPKTGVAATAKHFVGYGVPEGGRNWNPIHLSERELREVFLFPFEVAVRQAGLKSVMNGYHEIDGVPCGASYKLLTEILREEWGFDSVVVADYFSIDQLQQTHLISGDKQQSAKIALEAGIDIELPSTDCYGAPLLQALEADEIDMALVDRSVARLLIMKFEKGIFEQPYVDAESAPAVFDTPEQRALARKIAQKSIVLLKNADNLLPLRKDLKSIAVIGPNANNVRNLVGDYAIPCHIESLNEMTEQGVDFTMPPLPKSLDMDDNFVPMRPILETIGAMVSSETKLTYAEGCGVLNQALDGIPEAVEVARNADVAIVVVGDKSGLTDSCSTGEALDRVELGLPGVQLELVKAVYETGTPVVVVLVNGRPLSIPWIVEHIPAVLEAWLPGEEGAEAVADVLFGEYNPGGKLPVTVPEHVGQVPMYHYFKPSGGRTFWKDKYVDCSNLPLFPFGYGLSYTTFELDKLQVSAAEVPIGDAVEISVAVTNTGARAGEEVVQLYVRDELASVTRPIQELKGFKRVALEAGQSKTVRFRLHTSQLAFYDREMHLVVEPGEIVVMVGTSSIDLPLSAPVMLTGAVQQFDQDRVYFSQVQVVE